MTEANNLLANDLTNLSLMYNLQAVLQQMAINLGLVSAGTDGVIQIVNSANLYALAAENYNDATQWTTIAFANGLSDPQPIFPVATPLIIPAIAGTPSGGILPT